MMDLPQFYVVGMRPVKVVRTRGGLMTILKMNWDTGVFEYGVEYGARTASSDADVDHVTEDEFIQHVEKLRARDLQGEGPIFALYQTINAIEDAAKAEGRVLTDEEYELAAELRRQTYALFQAAHPDRDLD